MLVEFLRREFGLAAAELAPVFLRLQDVLGRIYYGDKNQYMPQSHLPSARLVDIYALSAHMIAPAGASFPTPEAMRITRASVHPLAFAGWPTPPNHRAAGAEAMVAEKRAGLAEAHELCAAVRRTTPKLSPEDARFLERQFEDLVLVARASCALFEAQTHHFLSQYGLQRGTLPDRERLSAVLGEMRTVRDEWQTRYPQGRYLIVQRLNEWLGIIEPKERGA